MLGGDRPDTGVEVDFRPGGGPHFAGAGGGQDGEFDCPGGDAFMFAQIGHEGAHFLPRQSRKVHHLGELVRVREQVLKMSSPAGRIVPLAVLAHRCPIEDRFDAAAQAGRCFRLFLPDRVQYLHDQRGVNERDWQRADDRAGVGLEGVLPLSDVFGALPAAAMGVDVGIRALVERHHLRSFERFGEHGGPAGFERVLAVEQLHSAFLRLGASFGKRDRMHGAQAHFALSAGQGEAENPTLGTGPGYLQPEPRTVAEIARLRRLAHR